MKLKDVFFEKLKSEYNGLVRPQLEKFIKEDIGLHDDNECHRVLYQLMI